MKRALLAITVGLTVFGMVFGLAAGLQVTPDQMASGSSVTVSGCDDAVNVSFGLATGDITQVAEVTVSDINTDATTGCVGQTLHVEVTDGTTTVGGSTSVAAASETVALNATIAAADVTVVNVTITG